MSEPNPRRRFNPWWLVPLAAVLSVVAIARQRAEVPERSDWQAAVEALTPRLEAGDGVAWTPYWAGEGRLFLHDLPGFHLPDVEQADFARYQRVWLLGAFGYDADDLPDGHTVLERTEHGDVSLELVQVGGERVLGDLRADLDRVRVERAGRGAPKACDFWDGRGWHCTLRKSADKTRKCLARPIPRRLRDRRRDPHCGLDPWLNVSRDTRVIGDFPRRCVWFHPVAAKTLRLTWPDAPVGVEVVVDGGFADQMITDHTRKEVRTKPAKLVVKRGDAALGERTFEPVKGWHRWRMADSGTGPLVIEATTTSQVDAHLCLDLTVRGPAGGAK